MNQYKIRTEYSFGSTYAPIERVVERLKAIGCKAAGIVDSGGTWGHVAWHEACREAGIKPMLGVELIVTGDEEATPAMWFLARNATGLRELYHLSSKAWRQKVSTRRGALPRLFPAQIPSISANIVKFAGEVLDREMIEACRDIVMDLNPSSRVLNHAKQSLAAEFGLRTIYTSDNAYAFPEDRDVFELMSDRGLKPTAQHILESFPAEFPDVDLGIEEFALPKAPMVRKKGDLEALCRKGIKYRVKHNALQWDEEHEERLKRELDLIKSKDYESYFLVVADMCRFAKTQMLVGPSRGSAAGSLVCYLTRITEIDPIPSGLFFERFIDVSRADLPDIDLDFPDTKRHLVFEYMAQKYGAANVAHIGTISRYKPRSALIQVCKRMKIPPQATAGVKIAMIERSSADRRANNCLEDTLTTTTPGKQLVSMYPEVMAAARLEGHASHTGIHAAGLLVCNEAIEDYCTVTDEGIAQVEKQAAESLGLLKIDVLGLRTLGILEDSGVRVPWYEMTFDDPQTYDVFNRRALSCIFQFEGQAMRDIAKQIEFRTIDDIDAVTALARPGPFGGGVTQEWLERKRGKPYAAIHPSVERHMANSFGLPIYQEQTLAIVREIGKFDWEQTSTIRKTMSKRLGKEKFDSFWPQFVAGAKKEGMSEEEARRTWELINAMGAWQMNKAHTYSYAVISYWTAWLKAHHPLEFAAANLRNARDEESALRLLREMVGEGLEYEKFSLERSEETWAVKDGRLVAGFDSLHGVGKEKARKFVEARNSGTLTPSQIEQINKAPSPFFDIFPMQTRFGEYYSSPASVGINGEVLHIAEFDGTQTGSQVFLGQIIHKNLRDINEDVLVKKRNGRVYTGPQTFLDLRVQDDTGQILVRIDRYLYEALGRDIFENRPVGTAVLVRATFKRDIRFGFVSKIKVLDE